MAEGPDTSILYEFRKNSRERVVARLKTYRGALLADVRVFATLDDGREVPTKKAISIQVAKLPEFQAAVNALANAAGAQEKPRAA